MTRQVFMTGASGFLGRELLRALLDRDGDRFALLVRSDAAEAQVAASLGEARLRRVRFVRGDLTAPDLGIARDEMSDLGRRVGEVWHLAASTSFEDDEEDRTSRTNIAGTERLTGALRRFGRLSSFYYLSTAYVCGRSVGEVPEGRFESPEGYKNAYERTKAACEAIVRDSRLPFTILRPSIIMGDSRTGDARGDTRTFYGFLLALFLAALKRFRGRRAFWAYWTGAERGSYVDFGARLGGDGRTTKNVVTIDDVVRVCAAVRESGDGALGKTFNIVNGATITMGDALAEMERALRVSGFRFDRDLTGESIDPRNPVEAAAHARTERYRPYVLIPEPRWRTENVDRLGVERVRMTGDLFAFLIERYVQGHLRRHAG